MWYTLLHGFTRNGGKTMTQGPQTLLPLPAPAISASTVSGALTKSLADTLLNAASPEMAAEEVSRDNALLAEARDTLETVRRLAGPCGRDHVYVALQPAIILYGPPDFGKSEAGALATKTWITLYQDALWQLPKEALEEAVSTYIAEGDGHPSSRVRMPKPAQIMALAKDKAERLRKIAWRLRVAVETAHKYAPPPRRSAEEIAAIQKMRDEAVARLRRMPGRQGSHASPRETAAQMAARLRAGALTT